MLINSYICLLIDGLSHNVNLSRTGKQVTSVSDSGSAVYSGDFNAAAGTSAYNANGALTSDTGRKISSVTWNEIGLPQTVTFSNGSTISYYYAADGSKLREVRAVVGGGTTTTTTIDWCVDLVLKTNYYPLGGPLPTGTSTAIQPEKYQGKEWNPALGRWLAQDPLAEK